MCRAEEHSYLHQDCEHVNFYKTLRIHDVRRSVGDWNIFIYWLKIGSIQPKFDKIIFFIIILSHLTFLCKKRLKTGVCSSWEIWICRLVEKQRYEVLVNLWRFIEKLLRFKRVCRFGYCLKTSRIENFLHWAQFFSIWVWLGKTFSSKTLTMFTSVLPVMWCKSVSLVHLYVLNQSLLTRIEKQNVFPTVYCWLTCRHELKLIRLLYKHWIHTLKLFFAEVFKDLKSLEDEHTNFFKLRVSKLFSRNSKSCVLQSCPKRVDQFSVR